MQLEISNFQIIKKASLEIKGITLLVGPTNSGKTSVIRAVRAVLLGKVGDSYIRNGSASCVISIASGKDLIVRSKTKTELVYFINGIRYEKIGRGVPEDLQEKSGFRQVELGSQKFLPNFYSPDEPQFLTTYSPSERFLFLSLILSENKFSKVLTYVSEQVRETKKKIIDLESRIKVIRNDILSMEEEKNSYIPLLELLKPSEDIEKYDEILSDLEVYLKKFNGLFEGVLELEEKEKAKEAYLAGYKDLQKDFQDLESLKGFISNINTSVEFEVLANIKYKEACFVLNDLESIEKVEEKVGLLGNLVYYKEALVEKVKFEKESDYAYCLLEVKLKGLDEELESFQKDIKACPLCDSDLDEEKKKLVIGRM